MEINKQDFSSPDEASRLADCDEVLLNYLMREYATKLKRLAYLYTNDHSESEDIIQEVFVSCYRNLSKFRNESNYETWLTRITINKCKDHLRHWSIRNLIYMPLKHLVKTEDSAEKHYIHSENSKEILKQISLLSHKFKEVLILYYFNDMTMQEISETLGINHNTVKSRLLRGKNALLKNLEGGNHNGTL
ncbi:RNA polymerase sigma factor [Sporosarcina highlanderae]|uniref:Sigma-70 family RNA polymerase sigma factor n=1 Tax=Sporosarcina highlanderae TaxID=3035916 RepID=A0ABT8JTR4_9BACL|nr:sigma-70 family RNA polymerase sigma factor [Sporosarcina highlanderae]MDN4608559.1 sigma-70 family RNA polymerase sigma factor [Sporosarcina highlanderae]